MPHKSWSMPHAPTYKEDRRTNVNVCKRSSMPRVPYGGERACSRSQTGTTLRFVSHTERATWTTAYFRNPWLVSSSNV